MPPSPTLHLHYRSEKAMTVFRVFLTKIFGPCPTFGHLPHLQEKCHQPPLVNIVHTVVTLLGLRNSCQRISNLNNGTFPIISLPISNSRKQNLSRGSNQHPQMSINMSMTAVNESSQWLDTFNSMGVSSTE